MADKRTCYAGDLTSDVVGKIVRIGTPDGGQVQIDVAKVEHYLYQGVVLTAVIDRNGDVLSLRHTDVIEVLV